MKKRILASLFLVSAVLLLSACSSQAPLTPEQQAQAALDQQMMQKAITDQNDQLCLAIANKDSQKICSDTIAEQKRKVEIVKLKDASKCSELKNASLKASCEAEIKAKIDADQKLEILLKETNSQNDLLDSLIQAGNVSKCTQLKTKELQTMCADTIYLHQAGVKADASICKKIVSQSMRTNCEFRTK